MLVPIARLAQKAILPSLFAFAVLDSSAASEADYKKQIRPLVNDFCLNCHSTKAQKGDLDLERFTSFAEVKRHPKVWQNVAEQLASKEMPPKDKPQPTAKDREKLFGWIKGALAEVARANAGDPGPVVLRRLSNAEFTYTLRDLTGIESLDPAREFPVDGAAGEGFMNVGNALVMSPALFPKYLDAAKDVASHAVLLPDGIRFSPKTTRPDWSDEIVKEIREIYRQYTDARGPNQHILQGVLTESAAGRLPLERYLKVYLEIQKSDPKKTESILRARGLNSRYFAALRSILSSSEPSFILDSIRARLRDAEPDDIPALAADIEMWQGALFKFNSVGHIGKVDGPKEWMESISPISSKKEIRLKIDQPKDAEDVTLYLAVGDNGDGTQYDQAFWREPKFVMAGRPDLLLRDVREVTRILSERRPQIFSKTTHFLAAVAEASAQAGPVNASELARKHNLETDALGAWLAYLGFGAGDAAKIDSHLTNKLSKLSGFDFVNGWGASETPLVAANSSSENVRIPGNVAARGVVVHPSPKLQIAAGWRSPINGRVRVEANIRHAHPECGNGVTWSLELRRGDSRRRFAAGVAQGDRVGKPDPIENLSVRPGDLISLLIGPRNGDHSCDLTAIELAVRANGENSTEWSLARDVSPDIHAGNPHADSLGNKDVWHFYTEPATAGSDAAPVIPANSILAQWELANDPAAKESLARDLEKLLAGPAPQDKDKPDTQLFQQLHSLGGPFMTGLLSNAIQAANKSSSQVADGWGVDSKYFQDSADLRMQAPSMLAIRLPADLLAGSQFITTGELSADNREGSVQMNARLTKPSLEETPRAGAAPIPNLTIIANENTPARERIQKAITQYRDVFPAALCYLQIVPIDEVITLKLYFRDETQLKRLMLDDAQSAMLDRLWESLHFVSQDAFTEVDAFEQILEYDTQERPKGQASPLQSMRKSILEGAENLRAQLKAAEPAHVKSVVEIAENAYRRPLVDSEKEELRALYRKLRAEELSHDEAIRLTLARIFVAPDFLYHAEKPGPGTASTPVNEWELANRLSFFLWSSAPDAELRRAAASGKLRNQKQITAQAHRMLKDPRTRRMASEFAAAWLHLYDFTDLREKSERHFPTFPALRDDMHEEMIRFFTDLFQRDGSILEIIESDHTFLNEGLAKHYDISGVSGPEWRRVDGIGKYERGGVLAMAATLSKQSGASRTSPILRGNWVSEVLLGEKLPRPPKDVPVLPDDEAAETLTVRQITEKHSSDPLCSGCHQRIDAFGFSLEEFDAIGRRRDRDLGNRPIDTNVKTMDGAKFEGIDGLRDYLLTKRRKGFTQQFCRKLLGYALGRGVQLSDEPLLKEMNSALKRNDYRFTAAINVVVQSRQFREIRGRETAYED